MDEVIYEAKIVRRNGSVERRWLTIYTDNSPLANAQRAFDVRYFEGKTKKTGDTIVFEDEFGDYRLVIAPWEDR